MKIKEGKSALEQNLYRSFLLLSATLVLISLGFTLFLIFPDSERIWTS